MLMKADQSTLLLIDVQERLMPAISEGDAVAERCITLATIAGLLGVPAIATEQIPEKLLEGLLKTYAEVQLKKDALIITEQIND